MSPQSETSAYRILVGGETFVCAAEPRSLTDDTVEFHLELALTLAGSMPSAFYWDGLVANASGTRRLALGRGGLDPLLAGEIDLSACVAIRRDVVESLYDAGSRPLPLAEAAALIARLPGATLQWCDGVGGRIDPAPAPGAPPRNRPAGHAERLTIALLLGELEVPLKSFFSSLRRQSLPGPIDLVAVAAGHESNDMKALARSLEACVAEDSRLSMRRYTARGPISGSYLANIAVGMATSDCVILADPRCLPDSPGALQRLADWAMSGDATAACPRIMGADRVLAAGMALSGEEPTRVVPWRDTLLSHLDRTAAAPTPWLFAVRRADWLACAGMKAKGELWTAEMAASGSLRGRTVLVGSETARWTGAEWDDSWDEGVALEAPPHAFAASAARDPEVSVGPAAARAPKEVPATAFALADASSRGADLRLLVFSDALGASQSITFVDGLAGARASGSAAVWMVEESTFPSDSKSLDQAEAGNLVEDCFARAEPNVVVVSRLGHASAWAAARAAARARGLPIVFHIDDDIFDLPASHGIERYRLARNAQRVRTLGSCLAEADLVLTSTPALAARLRGRAGHARFATLSNGAAGRPANRRAPGTPLVIGYMASASHDQDLAMIAPALNRVRTRHPDVRLSLFGSIAEQASADLLDGPVERHAGVPRDYAGFRRKLAALSFDIGLAPLRDTPFNTVKTATKWAEYAEAGAVVLASEVKPYAPISAEGAAITVRPDQWEAALSRLIEDEALRRDVASRADGLLATRFSWEGLESEVVNALTQARDSRRAAP